MSSVADAHNRAAAPRRAEVLERIYGSLEIVDAYDQVGEALADMVDYLDIAEDATVLLSEPSAAFSLAQAASAHLQRATHEDDQAAMASLLEGSAYALLAIAQRLYVKRSAQEAAS